MLSCLIQFSIDILNRKLILHTDFNEDEFKKLKLKPNLSDNILKLGCIKLQTKWKFRRDFFFIYHVDST
jgi:hypothetical protein